MTDKELKDWTARTEKMQGRWIVDTIHNGTNGRELLAYVGGTEGRYAMITPSGQLSLGTYEGAVPHIGEAQFTRLAVEEHATFEKAKQRFNQLFGESV